MNTALNVKQNKILNRRFLFWYGNFSFWMIMLVESVIVNPETLDNLIGFLRVFPIMVSGFAITCLIRLVFKKSGAHSLKLLMLLPAAAIYSLAGALLWTYTFFIFSHYIHGTPLKVPQYDFWHLLEINFFPISLWSGLYLGFKIWEEWNTQKIQFVQQQSLLRSSQLEVLKYQLNPHFLFNSLSSLRGLITAEPSKARDMVTHISEFLRYSLHEGSNNEVQLIKEINIIKQYLCIEQIRYNENLVISYDIAKATYDFMIPIFLIHPLVENAVKHGMRSGHLPLAIEINTKLENDVIYISVKNSGTWIEKNQSSDSAGIGLINIKSRLEHRFPGNHSFEIEKKPDHVIASIKIGTGRR